MRARLSESEVVRDLHPLLSQILMSVRLRTTCVQSSQSVPILPAVMNVCARQDTLEMERTVLVRHNNIY